MKNKFVSTSIFVILMIAGCTTVKNHVKIIGGTYRIVSRDIHKDSFYSSIFNANENVENIGIGFSFEIDYFAQNSQTAPFFGAGTRGFDGITDSITSVALESKYKKFYNMLNDDFGSPYFKRSLSTLGHGKEIYICKQNSREIFETSVFRNLDSLIYKYNTDKNFSIRDLLRKEMFIWFDNKYEIKFSDLENIEFKILLSDGREIVMKRVN